MGGANPSSDSGSSDAPNTTRSKVTKYRGEGGAVDFIKKGGITGTIFRGVKKAFDPKRNKKSKSGDVYAYDEAKEKIDYKAPTINNNDDKGNDNNSILSTNTEATKKVASSGILENSGATLKSATPTIAEISQATATDASSTDASSTIMSDASKIISNNKKGRRSTILQKAKGLGDTDLKITKKTLGA